ncbi:MAG: 2Fe-2S iron-sulfur cluster binding domain-containing protein [Gammaproteobacteria bacterium]|nr:2Fe-2S iron-sulfur cluster binding domain-containing protein [Gammaproteobacteria bacterium]
MSFLITLADEDVQFHCEANQTVLDAALQQGVTISYGCKNGLCGSCKGSLIAGEITYPDGQPDGISAAEISSNEALFCKATPLTDLSIKVKVIQQQPNIEVKKLPAKVKEIEHLSEDVIQMILQLPAIEPFEFKAGQWIYFVLKDGRKRAFSIANSPNDKNELELQIRHAFGGVFTDFVFNNLKAGALLQIEGPHGTFFYQQDNCPILLVAGGTGFAPIKGILEEMLEQQPKQSIHLFWGLRTKKDLYLQDLIKNWTEKFNISYTPVLSEPEKGSDWEGKTGYVHQAVLEEYPQLSEYAVYMAGPPQMIQSCQDSFVQAGLDSNKLYFDSFDYSTDAIDAMKEQDNQ